MQLSDFQSTTVVSDPAVFVPTTDQRSAPPGTQAVLHVINGEFFSGAERVQQLLGKRLGNEGFEPHFACLKPGKFRDCCELRAHQIIDEPMHGRFDLSVVSRIADRARSLDAVLLHAHTPRTALVTGLVAKRTGLPWVYHVHSPTARDSTRGVINRINTWIERYSIRNCDLLMTVSRSLRREMLRCGVPRAKLAVVANGVPALVPIDPLSRRSTKSWRLGMIALMRPRKGVEVALEAMREIKRRKLPVTLDLIGGFETDEYRCQILHKIQALDLESTVQWRGFTNDIEPVVRNLDGLLLPSLFGEGMPMVVLEAISAGVPVVATRVEGTPEVIRDGVEGLLAEPADPTSLAEQIQRLTSDRERWMNMCENALNRHRSAFSDHVMALKVAKAYRRILNSEH